MQMKENNKFENTTEKLQTDPIRSIKKRGNTKNNLNEGSILRNPN